MDYRKIIMDLFPLIRTINNAIGNSLIEYFDDIEFENELYHFALIEIEDYLSVNYTCKYPEFVLIAFSYIALKYYDGNFWEKIYEIFQNVNGFNSEQVFSSKLRGFLKKYTNIESISQRVIDFPLMQSIVPYKFIEKFFDFCYDIYVYNFEYSLKLFEKTDLFDLYRSLRSKMTDENDILEITGLKKSYTLIQPTKKIIINSCGINDLVNLTEKIIRMIDNYYWDKKEKIYSSYLMDPYKKWKAKISNEDKKRTISEAKKRTEFIRWTPKFILHNNKVLLETRNDKIPDTYDISKLCMEILENGKVIHQNNRLTLTPIIGGFRIKIERFIVNNPLNKLQYRLMCGDTIIFDSADKLYRNYILFDSYREEIKNHTDHFDENVYVLSALDENVNSLQKLIRTPNYELYYGKVDQNTHFYLANEFVNFVKITPDGINGQYHELAYYDETFDNKIYTNIYSIVFSSKEDISNIMLRINGHNIMLEELEEMSYEVKNNINYVSLDLSEWEDDFYKIKVKNIKTNKTITEFNFALDRNFKYTIKKENNVFYYDVSSSFFDIEPIKFNLNTHSYIIMKVEDHIIKLPFNLPIYCVQSKWYTFDNYIWREDATDNSIITFQGIKIKKINIEKENGFTILENIAFTQENISYKLKTEFLRSFFKHKLFYIVLIDSDNNYHRIEVLNKIIYEKTIIEYENNTLHIQPILKGKIDNLKITINHNNNEIVSFDAEDSKRYAISNLEISKKSYEILVNYFSYNTFTYEQVYKKKIFISDSNLCGRTLKVKSLLYSRMLNNEWKQFEKQVVENWILIKEKISDQKYKIAILSIDNNKEFYEYDLLDQEMILTRPIDIYGSGTAVITTEDDLFLYDAKNKKIFNEDNSFAMPIDEIEFELTEE